MSLIEIVVAIGISVVTMTGAAVFSNSLVVRAQDNFSETAALQLQTLVNEQIRLLELSMKRDIKAEKDPTEGGYLPSAIWTRICSESLNNNGIFLQLNFPAFNNSSAQTITLDSLAASNISLSPDTGEANGYKFYKFSNLNRLGSFESSKSPVHISIKKEMDSSLGQGDLLKSVKFTTMIGYTVLGKQRFTKPQEIKMVYSLVCVPN